MPRVPVRASLAASRSRRGRRRQRRFRRRATHSTATVGVVGDNGASGAEPRTALPPWGAALLRSTNAARPCGVACGPLRCAMCRYAIESSSRPMVNTVHETGMSNSKGKPQVSGMAAFQSARFLTRPRPPCYAGMAWPRWSPLRT
eukprot:6209894-Pleurochrysis_carterae.AAC.2